MKKVILVVVAMYSFGIAAQEKRKRGNDLPPEKQVELQVARMKIELDLTDKQTAEIRKMFTERQQELTKMRAEREATKDSVRKPDPEKRLQMKKNREAHEQAHEAQLKKILTAEQFDNWKKMKTERENRRKEHFEKRSKREN